MRRREKRCPGPTQALPVRGRNVLNADRSATNVSRAHSAGPRPLLAEGRKRKLFVVLLANLLCRHRLKMHFISPQAPKQHRELPPHRHTSALWANLFHKLKPQLRMPERFLTVVSSTLAAS